MSDLKKLHSRQHEEFIATAYEGRRSPSSGASIVDKGDVGNDFMLIECKATGEIGKPAKSTLVKYMEKIHEEAIESGRDGAVAQRFYMPDSSLSDENGFVDLITYLVRNDRWQC